MTGSSALSVCMFIRLSTIPPEFLDYLLPCEHHRDAPRILLFGGGSHEIEGRDSIYGLIDESVPILFQMVQAQHISPSQVFLL